MSNKIDVNNHSVIYWAFRNLWTDALNLYEPLPGTLVSYLKKYSKEDDEEYANRVRSMAQINICYLIVESTLSMLFSTNIEITSDKYQDEVNAFVQNCTQSGDSLIDFMREQVGPTAFTYGCADIVVDMPQQADDVLSQERQRSMGVRAYAYIIPPLNRPNWKIDDNGNFTEYRSEDIINTQIQGNLNQIGTPDSNKQYTYWTLDTVSFCDNNGNETSSKPNPYGLIPIVTCAPVAKSLRYPNERLGRSLIQDVIPLQKLIIQVMSLIYDYHEQVNWPERIWKQDTDEGNEPPTEGEISEGGGKRGKIMRGKESDYFLVEPNPRGVESMCNYLNSIIERCYQQVMMPSDANTNKTHQTQGTIRSNQAVLFNKLTTYTKNLSKTAKQIVEMALRVSGVTADPLDANVQVRWDTNFAFESFVNNLEQLAIMKQAVSDMSPLAVSEFAKKTLNPQFYGSGSGIMEQIEKQLASWAKETEAGADGSDASGANADTPQEKPMTLQQIESQVSAAAKLSETQ